MSLSQKNTYVSIVIPVYNEEGNLQPLLEAIAHACADTLHEIIVVDDGSQDKTYDELIETARHISTIRPIKLKKNFGQTAALAAGIDAAKGDIIIPLDGDGQNDPADIPRLLQKMSEGYDVVSGWRKFRKDPFLSRRLPSILANWLISTATGVHLHDYGCTLKAYKAPLLKNIRIYGEMHRFLPAWCAWQGGKISEIDVNHRPRMRGLSKYGLSRIFKVIIDLFTLKFFSGYLAKPNYLFSGTGFLSLIFSFLCAGLAFADKLIFNQYGHLRIPLLLCSLFFGLAALFLILMGLIAELLARLYFQAGQHKPYRLADE